MRVKKYLALIFAAILATTMLTACPWDIEDDAASDSSSVPSSSSRPSHDGGSSDDNDDDSSSAPSSPSTPDENEKVSVVNGKLIVKSGVSELKAEDIEDIKDQIKTVELTNIDVSPITFANCDKLETVTLDGVTINGNSTFAGCGNLRTVNLNNVDIENATSTFYLCRELTTVNGANTDVENLEGLFGAYGVGNYASGYPQYKYDCNDNCWNQIVSQSQTVVPDTGNALARYLLDLRL